MNETNGGEIVDPFIMLVLTVVVGILGMLGGNLDGYRRACRRYEKEREMMLNLAVRIPDEIVEQLDLKVDKIRYRSRAHLITAIIAEWLDAQEYISQKTKKDPGDL